MSTLAQSFPLPARTSLASPTAAIEILSLFGAVAVATLVFVFGWITPEQAAVLTLALLVSLDVLAWKRFDQGRHPCFLFLSMLTLLQGGRLIAYCAGAEPYPLRVGSSITNSPFDLSRDEAGMVLLCLALSAICVYTPCRWSYRRFAPPSTASVRQYLPYLYLLFYGSLPVLILKNYSYYQYAQEHGGYLSFWVNHGEFAATVPLWVRLCSLVSLPAFVGIFVFESRKKWLYLATLCYFGSSLPVLLMGSRMGIFGLTLALWYASGIKSVKKSRLVRIVVLAFVVFLGAGMVQALREDSDTVFSYAVDPFTFVRLAGNSLDVTEVVVKYRPIFSPYAASYLWNELQSGFNPHDVQHYFRGRALGHDVTVLLSSSALAQGYGTADSYIAEEYMIGGTVGVAVISLLIGLALHLLYHFSRYAIGLFLVLMVLPEFINMPRGDLLDWLSVLARAFLLVAVLGVGWSVYRVLVWLKQGTRGSPSQAAISSPLGAP
jgi:oligosaccharide repeat unit polymerase